MLDDDGQSLRGRRILVVEDEYLLADDLQQELERLGAVVIGPVSGVADALQLLADGIAVEGAILDVNLRGEKVFPVADALLSRAIPFVFTTGYDRTTLPDCYKHVLLCEKPMNLRIIARALTGT